jgi:prepilin-type N-terminal cleavage/methylation domain-containing protein
MKRLNTQKGFTLVELAIVMTIIGLLIGGILKGQELMENARVTATISQVKSYEAAVTTFRDSYAAIPGDMVAASQRVPGCGAAVAACNHTSALGGGNGIVGANNWATGGWNPQMAAPLNGGATTIANETQMFWTHLLLADLISGITNAPIRAGGQLAWGESHPAAKIGGGYVVGFADGAPTVGSPAAAGTGPSGLVVMITQSISAVPVAVQGLQPMTAARAGQIDRRIDDGNPLTGYVQSYGVAATCHGTVAAPLYLESVTTKDCGLVMRIQG